jgi:hypothetical protein
MRLSCFQPVSIFTGQRQARRLSYFFSPGLGGGEFVPSNFSDAELMQ